MARCGEIQDWLPAYLEGEVGAAMRGRVEAHLAECAPCAAELAELRLARALVESSPAPEPTPEFWNVFREDVRRRIASVPPPRPAAVRRLLAWIRAVPFLQPLPALGAAAALGLFLALALVQAPRPPAEIAAAGDVLEIGMELEVLGDLEILELLGDFDLIESLPNLARASAGQSA